MLRTACEKGHLDTVTALLKDHRIYEHLLFWPLINIKINSSIFNTLLKNLDLQVAMFFLVYVILFPLRLITKYIIISIH